MAYNPSLYNPYGQTQPYTWSQPSMPVSYQPGSWVPSQAAAQPTNGLVRVKGRQGADAYPMAPNSVSPVLLDEDQDVFYIKRTDASGVGTVLEYDFAPRVQHQEQQESFATTAMLEALASKVDALAEAVDKKQEQRTRRRKAEDDGQ